MCELLEKIRICDEIPTNIRRIISKLHVFRDLNENPNVLFVTIDDEVYGLGKNRDGCLGFGHKRAVPSPELIQQLCNKNIKCFVNGGDFVLALDEQNMIYGFGNNKYGQLATNDQNSDYLVPEIISFFNDKNIVQISCGTIHSLALTSDGQVYAWGDNYSGQIGCGETNDDLQALQPFRLQFNGNYTIKCIYCCYATSFAITTDGHVFSWGSNKDYQLGHNITDAKVWKPRLISNITDVKAIDFRHCGTYFLTTNALYFCGKYWANMREMIENTPTQIQTEYCVQYLQHFQLYIKYNFIYVFINNKIHKIDQENQLDNTNYNNLIDIYANELQTTYNTIPIECDFYVKQFKEISELGSGSFGTVFKVEDKVDDCIYAVKRIIYNALKEDNKRIKKEVITLTKLDPKYAVKYYDSWLESNYMYIKMELCTQTLGSVLNIKDNVFDRALGQPMLIYEYFISCEIFRELLECLEYLHNLHPSVIHRDINPDNILIKYNKHSNRFFKLGDFGLATDHERTLMSLTQNVGTLKYMAPEVMDKYYDFKVDIYSLGVTALQLFDKNTIDVNKYNSSIFADKVNKMYETIGSMNKRTATKRPTSNRVIVDYNNWSIGKHIITTNKQQLDQMLNTLKSCGNSFFYDFLLNKIT